MARAIRRVVTGHDQSGKAVVLSDGAVPVVHSNPMRPGQLSYEVWKTSAIPIPLAPQEPEPTGGKRQLHPVPMGNVFRISEVPPESDAIRNMTPEQSRAAFAASNAEEASTWGRGGRHPHHLCQRGDRPPPGREGRRRRRLCRAGRNDRRLMAERVGTAGAVDLRPPSSPLR